MRELGLAQRRSAGGQRPVLRDAGLRGGRVHRARPLAPGLMRLQKCPPAPYSAEGIQVWQDRTGNYAQRQFRPVRQKRAGGDQANAGMGYDVHCASQ